MFGWPPIRGQAIPTIVHRGESRIIVGASRSIVRQVSLSQSTWGASEIIAYPPGFEGFLAERLSLPTPIQETFKIAGVSPAPRIADKIGREARQVSWIRPICRACHLPKLKCGIIPLCIGQAKPTPGRLPTAPASVNAKQRFISYSSRRGGGKADIFAKISWNPPPDSPLTPRFPRHDPKSGTHTNSLPAPQNEIVPSS